MTKSMAGQTCLITGASNGIGLETARGLAAKGARLILVGRDEGRLRAAASSICAVYKDASVDCLMADLSRFEAIRGLAEVVRARYGRLDVLINNAGGMTRKRRVVEGFELCWKLNHLGYVLLTLELLPLLKTSAPARIVNVASTAHFRGRINFDDLQSEQKYRMWAAYGQSKLANILFTYALARRLNGQGVTVNCLHPGVVATGFAANVGPLEKLLAPLSNMFFISARKGAETSIYLASAPEISDISAQYFDRCAIGRSSDLSHDAQLQEQVWALSLQQIGYALF